MFKKNQPTAHGIQLKKVYGQHFLRDQSVVDEMLKDVSLNSETCVFEIGCGDGFLTKSILQTPIKKLWVFEIDPQWADYVKQNYDDPRMTIFKENILDFDFNLFKPGPWTILSNLPYQITFPILKLLFEHREILSEGIIMIQEEVAQKLIAQPGKNTVQALFYSHYFDLKLLKKIPPTSFYPPPKIYSRLVYLKPKKNIKKIEDETKFWKFVKLCFIQRRRTIKNNLATGQYNLTLIPEKYLKARAQELSIENFFELWNLFKQN